MIIDFSAHDTWAKCPAMWFEKYVNRRRKHWPNKLRDDALCLGSMVHEGLRVWQQSHIVAIPQEVQDEMTPTRECYELALELVHGYAQAYPEEAWPLIVCEEPVVWPLYRGNPTYHWLCTTCNVSLPERDPELAFFRVAHQDHMTTRLDTWDHATWLDGLAKIDSYFYVPDYTEIETGIGFRQMLQPGWWIHEYKTKSAFIEAGLYMQSWQMGMQASYQVTALTEYLLKQRQTGQYDEAAYPHHGVEGVLVNVIEKPKRHVPKRKCKNCQESYEFATWVPTGTGQYACPVCGNRQTVTALKDSVPQIAPSYYRICVTRTPQQLDHAQKEMVMVGQRMQAMQSNGLYSEPWNKHACVDFRWRKACDYFGVHNNYVSTLEDPEFETVPDYRGLTQVEGVE